MATDEARQYEQINENWDSLMRTALGKGLSPQDAQDAVQNAYLTVLSKPKYRSTAHVGTLVAVTRSRAVDLQRRNAPGKRRAQPIDSLPIHAQEILLRDHQTESPEAVALRREEYAAISDGLSKTKPNNRRAFLLHVREGMPYSEIADTTETSTSNVKTQIHRARGSIKKSVSQLG